MIFVKYLLTSLFVAGIDYSIFWVSQYILENLFVRLMLARSLSIIIQYLLVRFKVFNSKLPTKRTFPAYVLLVVVNAILVEAVIKFLGSHGVSEISAKVASEIVLYLPNFWILKQFVFNNRENIENGKLLED